MKETNSRKLRVLHIANGDDCFGSAQCLYEILRYELNCKDITPIVLTPQKTGMNDFCEKYNIENYSIKFCEFMYPMHDKLAKIKYCIRKIEYYLYKHNSIMKVEKLIDFSKIDIIHTNNSLNDLGARISKKYKIPHVWHLREGGPYQQNLRPYFSGYANYMAKSNSHFIAVSNAVKKEWIKLGIPQQDIKVIYDGVSMNKNIYKKTPDKRIRFVMTGSYSESKGQIQVIEAISLLSDEYKNKIHVDFWGNGVPRYTNFLNSKIVEKNLSNVIELKGFSQDVWETLSHYDIGLNCTRFEAFGRTTVEFLINGMPVIASRLGANLELINDSNGIFYEYGNVDELKNCIIYMVDNNSIYNSKNIADYSRKKYSCDISNRNIIDYFKSIIKEIS